MSVFSFSIAHAIMYPERRHLYIACLCVVGLLFTFPSRAEFVLPETVQIHGFGSVGYFNSSDNNFFGETTGAGDMDFWELGINGSWRPYPNLQLSTQVVSRKAGETDDGEPRIDYGFLDYSFISDLENLWGVRAGRVVHPFGLYNDTRDMPFTRPSILLPQSIYFDANRQFSLSSDGGQLYGERRTDIGSFSLQLQVAHPRTDDPSMKAFILGAAPGGELEGKTSFLGRLLYEKDQGKLRLALSGIHARTRFEPGDTGINDGRFNFKPIYLSAQYNAERWSLTSEYAWRRTEFEGFGPTLDDDFTGESYYVQGTYRFSRWWEGVLRYDVLYWDRDDRDGRKFEAATGGVRPAHSRFAKDLTVGLRWDVVPNFMLRFEYHNVDGTAWLSVLENPDERTQRWELFALLAAFRF